MLFDDACAAFAALLEGETRREVVAGLARQQSTRGTLPQLRDAMESHTFDAGGRTIDLKRIVRALDERTVAEGFHALNDWNGTTGRFNEETIPVEVVRYVLDARGDEGTGPAVPGMLLDYYCMYLLALLSLRAWDDGDANQNLNRIGHLLEALQSPQGSGQRFAANAETLLLIATSHYEPDEAGYDLLFERSRALNAFHQAALGLCHAASMGSHLRFGFEATYNRDIGAQRDDNLVDYPWLSFALLKVMREYIRLDDEGIPGTERERVVEALLQGLTADAEYFCRPPKRDDMQGAPEQREFAELFQQHRSRLVDEFERLRPTAQTYSPISFFFNFAYNIVKGTTIDAALWGEPWPLTLNDLLTGLPVAETTGRSKEGLAKTLMGYARANPDRIRGKLMPVVVYDPEAGRRAFGAALRAIKA